MKTKVSLLLILLSGMAGWLQAQPRISLSVDAAQFRQPDGTAYLEIYYSFPESNPLYTLAQNLYTCDMLMSLEILQNDTLWANKTWRIANTVADTSGAVNSKQLVDLLRYPVQDGEHYQITLFARDLNRSSLDSIQIDLDGQGFSGENIAISDMILANTLAPYDSSCAEVFHRRFYCLVPNPEITFGENSPQLNYYFEVYNLLSALQGKKCRIILRVLDNHGNPVTQVAPIIHEREARQNLSREVGQIPVSDLPSGAYTLEYIVADTVNTILSRKSRIFLVSNPSLKPLSAVFADGGHVMTFLDDLTLAQLNDEFDKLYAVTTREDRDIFRSIKEADAKRDYLYSFWNGIKPDDYSLTEDFRVSYMKEIEHVRTYYGRTGKPGWRTDRGIVYLRYGRPSNVEHYDVGKETKPYEIWTYDNIENGVIFVFVDRAGFNQYELIHSTKRGELYDPNWQRMIQPTTTDFFKM